MLRHKVTWWALLAGIVLCLSGGFADPTIRAQAVGDIRDIVLSDTTVAEDAETGIVVGRLQWKGPEDRQPRRYELVNTGESPFSLQNGSLTVENAGLLNYEEQTVEQVHIRAIFPDDARLVRTFNIQLLDRNDPPSRILLDEHRVPENSPAGTVVSPIRVIDEDTSDTHELELLDANSPFAINANNLVVVDSSRLDYEEQKIITVHLRATDASGGVHEQALEIQLLDRNDPPSSIEFSNNRVDENSPAGTTVGTITAVDQDSGDTHSYTLLDDGEGRFELQGQRITVAPRAFLNYERQRSIPVTVRAEDKGGLAYAQKFYIRIKNVNEAPELSKVSNIIIAEDQSSPPLTVQIEDPETRPEHLQVELISSDPNIINPRRAGWEGTGALRDMVITPEPNANGVVHLTLEVSDGRLSTSQTFRVRVLPVNDAPEFAEPPHASLDEGDSVVLGEEQLPLTDVDNSAEELYYTLRRLPQNGTLYRDTLQLEAGARFTQQHVAGGRIRYRHDGSETTADTLYVSVTDPSQAGPDRVPLAFNIHPVNDSPEITSIDDQTILEDASTPLIPFQVKDAETAGVHLKVRAFADDRRLLPDTAISLGGIDQMRTLRLRPAADQYGKTNVQVIVSDGDKSTEEQFMLHVEPVNDAPKLEIPDTLITKEDVPADSVYITLYDVETEFDALELEFEVNDESLLRAEDASVEILDNGKALKLIPQPNQYGQTELQLSVSDGQLEASQSMLFIVKPVNDPPSAVELYGANARIHNDSLEIEFDWERASDPERDPLSYQLQIQGADLDTLIKGIDEPHFVWNAGRRLESNTTYTWTVKISDGDKLTPSTEQKEFVTPVLPDLPQQFKLAQNFPNPFNPVTSITYRLPVSSRVRLTVYDMSGRAIAHLVEETQSAGEYTVQWNAGDRASGVYVYRLVAISLANQRQHTETRKMMLVK